MRNTTFFALPAWFHPKIFLAIKSMLGKHTSPQTGLRMADQNCVSPGKSLLVCCTSINHLPRIVTVYSLVKITCIIFTQGAF